MYQILEWEPRERKWVLMADCEALQQAETAYDNAVYRGHQVKMVNKATGRTVWHERD